MAQQRRSLNDIYGAQPPHTQAPTRRPLDEVIGTAPAPPTAPSRLRTTLGDTVGGGIEAGMDWLTKNVQPKLEDAALRVLMSGSGGLNTSVFDPPDLNKGLQGVVAPLMAGTIQTLAHPIDNAPTLAALIMSTRNPARLPGALGRIAATAPMLARSGMAGVGGGVGGYVRDGAEGVGSNAWQEMATNLAGEGAMKGLGALLRGTGRMAGYKALSPSEADKAAYWLAVKGTPEGYLPVRGKRLIKDDMLEWGKGNLGGERYAQSAVDAANRTNAELSEIVSNTMTPQGVPLRQFAVDRATAANAVDPLARRAGGPGGGGAPLPARKSMEEVKADFLKFDPESVPFDVPLNRQLGEGTRPVPLADVPVEDRLNIGTGPFATARREAPLRAGGDPSVTTPRSGDRAHQTPQLVQRPQTIDAAQPMGGTIELPTDVARRLGHAPAAPDAPSTIISFENGLRALRTIDDELAASMQRNIGAVGKAAEYVPSPSEQALMAIRKQLREQLNAAAPTTSLGRTMAEINPEASRNIVRRDIAKRATGDDTSGMKARAGVSRQGTPTLSLFENIYRFGGVGARPFIRGGEALQRNAAVSPQFARLLQLLVQNPIKVEQSGTANVGGYKRP